MNPQNNFKADEHAEEENKIDFTLSLSDSDEENTKKEVEEDQMTIIKNDIPIKDTTNANDSTSLNNQQGTDPAPIQGNTKDLIDHSDKGHVTNAYNVTALDETQSAQVFRGKYFFL